jgi:hypothetical protein
LREREKLPPQPFEVICDYQAADLVQPTGPSAAERVFPRRLLNRLRLDRVAALASEECRPLDGVAMVPPVASIYLPRA